MQFDATPERIAKLPQWAQEYIEYLRMRLNESEDAFAKATVRAPRGDESGLIVNPYSEHAMKLPLDTMLRFWLSPELAIDVSTRHGGWMPREALSLTSYSRVNRPLMAIPGASNQLYVGGYEG